MTHSLLAMKHLDGSDPKVCRKWLKNVNKFAGLTGQKHVAVAYKTVDWPVSDDIEKAFSEGLSWPELELCWKWVLERW